MLMMQAFPLGDDFEVAARNAVRQVYNELGHLPRTIYVPPGVTEYKQLVVGIPGLREVTFERVPILVHYGLADLNVGDGEFGMDVLSPDETMEMAMEIPPLASIEFE